MSTGSQDHLHFIITGVTITVIIVISGSLRSVTTHTLPTMSQLKRRIVKLASRRTVTSLTNQRYIQEKDICSVILQVKTSELLYSLIHQRFTDTVEICNEGLEKVISTTLNKK